MAQYSGFISKFQNSLPSSGIDILSNIVTSDSSYNITSPSSNGVMPVYYFYLGDLLIQFSNVGTISRPTINNNAFCTINFPMTYLVEPTVLITPPINAPIGLSSTSTTGFEVVPGTANNKYPNWISIGLNPSSIFEIGGPYTISSDASYNVILTFTTDSSITFNKTGLSVNYFVVGAGGDGNSSSGGGGGGGGQVQQGSLIYTIFQTYLINIATTNASNTSIGNLVSSIGGQTSTSLNGGNSGNGFSGGIGSIVPPPNPEYFGGGGGGSSGNGQNGNSGGAGGAGTLFNGIYYGVGGAGGDSTTISGAVSGAANTGDGGQGKNGAGSNGTGGSGVVIIYFNI